MIQTQSGPSLLFHRALKLSCKHQPDQCQICIADRRAGGVKVTLHRLGEPSDGEGKGEGRGQGWAGGRAGGGQEGGQGGGQGGGEKELSTNRFS